MQRCENAANPVSSWPSAWSIDTAPAWAVLAVGDETLLPSLIDAGRGTPPPFDEWRGGLGLALPVARRVIEALGGALWSAPGERPRAGSALATSPSNLRTYDDVNSGGRGLRRAANSTTDDRRPAIIAVVDDDSGFAGYLRTFLALRGYEARSYTRGDEIVAAIRQGEPPDIVLLDVAMPGMDGLQTLKALKAARPSCRSSCCRAASRRRHIVEAVRLGAADYVVKPDDPEGLGEIALDAAIKQAFERNRLVSELTDLRRQLSDDQSDAFIGWSDSPAMRQVALIIEQVADSDVTVLIRGESGVGKELVARAIHQRSTRKQKPFVKVNCAALPAELLESELFGHEKGAFTGAATTRIGKFEQAHRGTIFLDEIGEMKPAAAGQAAARAAGRGVHQARKQQEDQRRRARRRRHQPRSRADDGARRFPRGPLLPPQGDRGRTCRRCASGSDEILKLTDFFIAKYSQRYNRPVRPLSDELRERFLTYEWPGNVRELENMIKRFVILQDEQLVVRELNKPRLVPNPPPIEPAPPAFHAPATAAVLRGRASSTGRDRSGRRGRRTTSPRHRLRMAGACPRSRAKRRSRPSGP